MFDFNNKTILVTGGAGFIGSGFIRLMNEKHPQAKLVNLDALTYSGDLKRLADLAHSDRYRFVKGDVRNLKEVFRVFEDHKPDFLVNFAAETHVDRSIHRGVEEFIDTNIKGVFHLLEACKKFGIEKFVHVSTDEVYGELELDDPDTFTEKMKFRPSSPYSATKAGGDCLCRAYYKTWNVPVVVTNCSNNYGPWQYPEKMIPFWIHQLAQDQPVPVYGDGMNVRDWIHVDDHNAALELCLAKGQAGETYNIGANNERNNLEMAKLIIRRVQRVPEGQEDAYLKFVQDRPGHDRRYAVDSSKIETELGWRPQFGRDQFLKKLQETVDWYLARKDWLDEVRDRVGRANAHIGQ